MGMEFPINRRQADDSYHALQSGAGGVFVSLAPRLPSEGGTMRAVHGYVLVIVGAGLGGALRHTANLVAIRHLGPDLPWGTLLVNVVGSVAVGGLAGFFATRGHATQALQLFLITGVLGGFTTFSAFSLEAALLWERGQVIGCVLFVLASVALSIAGVFAGLSLRTLLA